MLFVYKSEIVGLPENAISDPQYEPTAASSFILITYWPVQNILEQLYSKHNSDKYCKLVMLAAANNKCLLSKALQYLLIKG